MGHIADRQELWSLRDPNGWVMMAAPDGTECFPIWPHADYARASMTGDWKSAHPELIPLSEWRAHWLPGLKGEKRLIAVFPSAADNGVTIDSDRFDRYLRDELDRIE